MGVATGMISGDPLSVPVTIVPALMILVTMAAWFDLRERRIPNSLNAAGAVLGLVLHTQASGLPGLWFSVRGLLLALCVYFVLFALRAMGAGDVKLQAAVGSMTGAFEWAVVAVIVSLIGGAVAVVVIGSRGRWGMTVANAAGVVTDLVLLRKPWARNEQVDVGSGKGLSVPHAVPIALGVWLYLWLRLT